MSARIYALLVMLLLGVVYVVVLPWFAVVWRLRRGRPTGWHPRVDPDVSSLVRLRAPF